MVTRVRNSLYSGGEIYDRLALYIFVIISDPESSGSITVYLFKGLSSGILCLLILFHLLSVKFMY